MEIREVSQTPLAEVTAMVLERLPSVDEGTVRGSFDQRDARRRIYLETRDDSRKLTGFAYSNQPRSVPDTWRFTMVVCRRGLGRRGVGGRLWSTLRERIDEEASVLFTFVMDDDEPAAAAAAAWGFTVAQHSVTSELDLTALVPGPLDTPAGVVLDTCDDLTFDDDGAVAAMLLASQTNPEAEVGHVLTLEIIRRPPSVGRRLLAVLARVDGQPAAISFGVADHDQLHIHYTGVDPAYRGRDLARHTKEFLHRHAANAGIKVAITDNEDNNAGIRHVNDQLGYRKRSGMSWMTAPATHDSPNVTERAT